MPSVPLPENASLEHLKNQAKLVQDLVHSGDEGGLDMVVEFHPKVADRASVPSLFKRSDAQLVVARLYGFATWVALREHLGVLDDLARPDIADGEPSGEADRFVALGCVTYGEQDAMSRIARAHAMLAEHPELAEETIASMATAGNQVLLARQLEADPDCANESWGPNRWPPLLYCAYSRVAAPVPSDATFSTLECARMLLDAGADPNAGFLWRGLVPPFTALTGAFGHGEQDQPPHADGVALARLLLDAGADPNDGQTLYNNGLAGTADDDPTHLQILVEYGLGTDMEGPWYERFGARLTAPEELLYDELEVAAHRGLPNRMRFLASLGLDLNRRVGRSRKTPRQLAERKGHQHVLAVLADAGVTE